MIHYNQIVSGKPAVASGNISVLAPMDQHSALHQSTFQEENEHSINNIYFYWGM